MGKGGAPPGNQFWKVRAKHGRDILFFDAELLREAAQEYFEWCDKNPLYKVEQTTGKQKPVYDEESGEWVVTPPLTWIPEQRPYTVVGFCRFVDCSESWLRDFRRRAAARGEDDFSAVINWIYNTINAHQQEGALQGMYNANLTARLQGIADTSKQEIKAEITDKTEDPFKKMTYAELYELRHGKKPDGKTETGA